MIAIALLCSALLLAAAGLHFYWAMGGKAGLAVALPQREDGTQTFKPRAIGTMAVGLGLLAMAIMTMAFVGLIELPIPTSWLRVGVIVAAAVFLARAVGYKFVGFLKTVRETPFARFDTLLYSPICLVLGTGLAALAFKVS